MAITFWIAAVGIPALLLIGNAVVRHLLGMEQSAGADVGLMFTAFDAAVLVQVEEFRNYVSYAEFNHNITSIFTFLIIMCLVFWFVLVAGERTITEYRVYGRTGYPFLQVGLSFILPAIMIFANIAPFVYGM